MTLSTVTANDTINKLTNDELVKDELANSDSLSIDAINNQNELTTKIEISLAYALTSTQQIYDSVSVVSGTTIYDALKLIGWFERFPELSQWCKENRNKPVDNKSWRVGIFSVKKPLNYELAAQDRIEIYRPLTLDPMRKRKKRAINQ